MIKILYVIENIFFGGGERAFAQIIARLNRQNYQIYVASLPGGLFEEKIRDHAKIFPFDLRNKFNFANISDLVRIIKENNIDIIHCQGGRGGFFARLAAHKTNVPLVNTVAMLVEGFNVGLCKKMFYVLLDRFSEKYVDKFIVLSEILKNTLIEKHKIAKGKIVKITNGVEINNFIADAVSRDKIRNEFSISADNRLVGFIGRLTWQKGLTFFLQAIKQIEDNNPELTGNIKYLIVGEGEQRKELENQAENLNIAKKIIFNGFRKDVRDIISALDVLVLPSLREGQPIILLEAMSMGKAIITTDIEGMNETIENNVNGMLVTPKNGIALAEAIIFSLKNEAAVEKMGVEARQSCINKFNIDDKVGEHERLYESIIVTRI